MPRQALILEVFIACPSDMQIEREIIEKAIDELNSSLGGSVLFRSLHWQRDALPEVATEPQAAINSQLVDRADILCAVIGTKLGTPTKSHESGTVEEIRRFLESEKSTLGGHFVQVYFQREPVDPFLLDAERLRRVNEFRADLGRRGVFYKDFNTLEVLRSTVSNALRAAAARLDTPIAQPAGASSSAAISESEDESEQDGILDYKERFEEKISDLALRLSGIQNVFDPITLKTQAVTSLLTRTGGNGINIRSLLDEEVGSAVEAVAKNVESILIGLPDLLESAFHELEGWTALAGDLSSTSSNDEITHLINVLIEKATETSNNIKTIFVDSVAIPRLTRRLIRANRQLSLQMSALANFTDQLIVKFTVFRDNLEHL